MSKDIGEDDQVWPTRCPACGTEMTSAVIDFDQSNENRAEFNPGEMVAVDYCPNPDCPAKATHTGTS